MQNNIQKRNNTSTKLNHRPLKPLQLRNSLHLQMVETDERTSRKLQLRHARVSQ